MMQYVIGYSYDNNAVACEGKIQETWEIVTDRNMIK